MPLSLLMLLSLGTSFGHWLREGRNQVAESGAEHHGARPPVHGPAAPVKPVGHDVHHAPWYATLWLTGVDYFSSLGYAPGIAIAASGFVAPVATLILVLVTFLAAVPVYAFVAKHSYEGEGSIKMIERLTTSWGRLGWLGKTIVLILLGFAMTDFVITITLSAADATHHLLHNPLFSDWLPDRPVLITAGLIGFLCAVFLKGFKEAIWLAVLIAFPYMALNAIIIFAGFQELAAHPEKVEAWLALVRHFEVAQLKQSLQLMSPEGAGPVGFLSGSGPMMLVAVSALVFPKLALGMSGFETGVSVMPHITGEGREGRVRNTRKMLFAAATLMCLELMGSIIVTTLLIPPEEFRVAGNGVEAGKAMGRALAYLAHDLLGNSFGTVYDVNTVAILWFAGASAMAGLLNIIPRYLPRFGMSPLWLEFRRPLVLVVTTVCLVVNDVFDADVEKQAGAYATGVLVLMASGAFAVLLAERERRVLRWIFGIILAVFLYVLVMNAAERPDGLKIASLFIIAIIVASVWSRWRRASELRVGELCFANPESEAEWNRLKNVEYLVLLPLRGVNEESRRRCEGRQLHHEHSGPVTVAFMNVTLTDDPSQFATPICVEVRREGEDMIIHVSGAVAVANAIAYVALQLNADEVVVGLLDSGTPVQNAILYVLFGTGEVGYAVRAIFVRLREEALAERFVQRKGFDQRRDRLEQDMLRDAVLLSPAEREARMLVLFEQERREFATQVTAGAKLPRLIMYD